MFLLPTVWSFGILVLKLFSESNAIEPAGRKFTRNDKCKYHVNNDSPMTFSKANSTCLNLGGSLAMLKPIEVQNLIENQIIAQYGAGGLVEFWVGGYRSHGVWIWMDGSKIPLTGISQKWRGNSQDYMIISSYKTTRNNMRWYSKGGESERGYVCEVAVIDPCGSVNCQNCGTCIRTGCQAKCICAPGFHGNLCQYDCISITTSIINYIVVQDQIAGIKLKIASNHGPTKIEVLKGTTSVKTFRNAVASLNITIGPLQNQTEGDIYTLRATPESAPDSYYKYANVIIRVEGPPTVNISTSIVDLPTGKEEMHIRCEATGVPKPSVSWKHAGIDVTTSRSVALSQFTYDGYQWLLLNNTQTGIGKYYCYAVNVVAGEMRVGKATLLIRGKDSTTKEENGSANGGSKSETTYATPGTTVAVVVGVVLIISVISNTVLVLKLRRYQVKPTDPSKDHPSVRPYEITYIGESPYHYENESVMESGKETPPNSRDREAPVDSATSTYEIPRPLNDETNPYEDIKITK